ncbi:MAG: transposase, partial [archaeon]|nr:transposase [archaeon]
MSNSQAALPIIIYFFNIISENQMILHSYLFKIMIVLGVVDPVRLFMSILIQPIIGIEFQSHYRESYSEIKKNYSSWFQTYCPDTIHEYINKITSSMAAWKLFLFQAKLVKSQCPELLSSPEGKILDIDVTTMKSCSSKKEGAEIGFNKKSKGKPCFQLSASFIGRIFVDAKLFSGHVNPKSFFKKAVKRAKSLGLSFEIVRADSAYLTLDNLLFLTKLCLGYAIGMSGSFSVVKEGIRSFKELARRKSLKIISVAKGVSILDLGFVTLNNGIQTRVIIVRRISRKKNRKTGKWKIRTYYYAIASNLDLPATKLFFFYHKRQCIEAAFRELKNHYYLERLPFIGLKANEFWIVCKILAMTLFKI